MTDRSSSRAIGRLSPAMRWATFTAWGLALVATVAPSDWSTIAGALALGLIITAPILRVLLLVVAWWTEQDFKFVALALALLSVIATGAVIALVT